jgi:L-ascorbate metabolism protein UlaG (beta-lactamase superfamily)
MKSHALWALLGGTLLMTGGHAWAQAAAEAGSSVTVLHRDMPEKEAAIWYLGQDSFAVKTRSHLLIFDPLNPGMENSYVLPKSADSLSEGVVNPDTIKDLDVVVFVSNMADSHYGTGIWPWRRYIRKVTYVFGWDPIINQDNHEYIYMKPREQRTIEGVDVTTAQSDMFGVSFLVKVDGLVLYHGGNHILLEPAQKLRFDSEIDYLASKAPHPDIVFMEFQTGAGNRPPSIASGIWYADRKLSPLVIFPMGAMNGEIPFRDRRTPAGLQAASTTYEPLIKDLIKEAPSDAIRAKLIETGKRGSLFLYRDGKIVGR